jgi:tetratricopeptide (TPR) repeat protein
VLSELRELDAAQSTLREALVLAERLHGAEAIEVAEVLDELRRAIGLAVCGDAGPEELALAQRALAIRERVWGHDAPKLAPHVHSVALGLAVRGLTDDALPLFERTVALAERDADARMLDGYLDTLANALASKGRVEDAVVATRRALGLRKNEGGMKYVTNSLHALAHGLSECERLDALLPMLSEVLEWPEWPRPADRETAITLAKVGALRARALDKAGRHEEAAAEGRRALPVLEADWPDATTLAALRSIVGRTA